MNIIPYFMTVASIVGTVASSFRKRWCFYVWLCTSAFWCVFNAANGSYAQALLYAFNFTMAILGLVKWRKFDKRTKSMQLIDEWSEYNREAIARRQRDIAKYIRKHKIYDEQRSLFDKTEDNDGRHERQSNT